MVVMLTVTMVVILVMILVMRIMVILSHEMTLLMGFMMIVNDHNRTLYPLSRIQHQANKEKKSEPASLECSKPTEHQLLPGNRVVKCLLIGQHGGRFKSNLRQSAAPPCPWQALSSAPL